MNIVLLQTDIEWMDVESNLRKIDLMVNRHPHADLFVLPEMFSTGFCMQPELVAQGMDGTIINWMKNTAQKFQCAVVGSVPIKENTYYYNRMCFVTPDGNLIAYDKRHLFSYSGENKHYTSGKKRVIVTYQGIRFLLQVCYDLRFPIWSRNTNDYDVALYVANWPIPRIEVWKTLLRARAIENQCYVLGVNRVGEDPNCKYNGFTTACDYYGRTLGELNDAYPGCLEVHLNLDELERVRQRFPVLKDADTFQIECK